MLKLQAKARNSDRDYNVVSSKDHDAEVCHVFFKSDRQQSVLYPLSLYCVIEQFF